MQINKELKPCPFCSYIGEVRRTLTGYFIQCSHCGASTAVYDNENTARKAWNMRERIKVPEHCDCCSKLIRGTKYVIASEDGPMNIRLCRECLKMVAEQCNKMAKMEQENANRNNVK